MAASPASTTSTAPARIRRWLPPLLPALLVLAAYTHSFNGPFLFDDIPSIAENPSIRRLTNFGQVLNPPIGEGLTVGARPLLNLSFALNHAVGGLNPVGYRVANLAIHLVAGFLLFALVRATLTRRDAQERFNAGTAAATPPPGWASTEITAGIAMAWWCLHPLQTSAVTYIVQRAESLAGLFCILSLFSLQKAADAGRSRAWLAVASGASLAGMLTKETAAVTPIALWLYDRTFLAGGFREAWRARGFFYPSLAIGWLALGWLGWHAAGRGGSAGFGSDATPWTYLLTQAGAICHYLRLTVWPEALTFDYGVALAPNLAAVWPAALAVVGLLALTVLLVRRRPAAGFLAAWFFIFLAPSSSFVPVASQTMAEHRMYLPLAALAVAAAWALVRWTGRSAAIAVAATLAVAIGWATFARNRDYASARTIWTRTVEVRPENPRAHNNLGVALQREGQVAAARREYEAALRLRADYADAHNNLGQLLFIDGHFGDALKHFEAAIAARPRAMAARLNYANTLVRLERFQEAETVYRDAVALAPDSALVRAQFGAFLLRAGRAEAAASELLSASQLDPDNLDVLANQVQALLLAKRPREALGPVESWQKKSPRDPEPQLHAATALAQLGRPAEALKRIESALLLNANLPEAHAKAAQILFAEGQSASATAHLQQALALGPRSPEILLACARLLVATGRLGEALAHCETALAIAPTSAPAHSLHGLIRLRQGAPRAAIEDFSTAVKLDPADAAARQNLALALMRDRRPAEALPHYEMFLRQNPNAAVGYFNYALCLHQVGRKSDALTAVQQALQLQPDFHEAQTLLRDLNR